MTACVCLVRFMGAFRSIEFGWLIRCLSEICDLAVVESADDHSILQKEGCHRSS